MILLPGLLQLETAMNVPQRKDREGCRPEVWVGTHVPVVGAPGKLLSLSITEGNDIYKAELIETSSDMWGVSGSR